MTYFLLLAFFIQCSVLTGWGLARKDGILQFPFLAALVFGLWAWPQLYGLSKVASVPNAWIDRVIVMSMLCLGSVFWGHTWSSHPSWRTPWNIDRRRLFHGALALTAIGLVAFVMTVRLPAEAKTGTGSSGASGIFVVYFFFSQVLPYALAALLILAVERPTLISLSLAVVSALVPLYSAIFYARRTEGVKIVFLTATILWFVRKKAVPRWLFLVVLSVGTLFIYNVNYFRTVMRTVDPFLPIVEERSGDEPELEALRPLQDVLAEGGWEMNNAVHDMAAVDQLGAFDYGLFHWNRLVFSYIPSQFLGREFKDSLMTEIGDAGYGVAATTVFGYENNPGSTHGGVTDCFASFWYLGCLKFFVIAYVLRRLYDGAINGSVFARVAYGVFVVYGCISITHSTDWFVTPWIHFALFFGPILLYSRVRPSESNAHVFNTQYARAVNSKNGVPAVGLPRDRSSI